MHFYIWKPTKGHNSKSYGPLTYILVYVYKINPATVHVYKNFQLSSFLSPEKSVLKNFKNGKIGIPTKGHLFVLRFYGPVNPMGSCRARSIYLTTRLLGRLSPLSG